MITQSQILQKIPQLIVEAQTGIKTPKKGPKSLSGADTAAISSDSQAAALVYRTLMGDQQVSSETERVTRLKEKIIEHTYEMTDEMAEEIAARIVESLGY